MEVEDPRQYIETPPDSRTWYTPEYDYKAGYDVFTLYQVAVNAFASCRTDLSITFDDVITPAEEVRYDSIGWIMDYYSQTTGGIDPQFACGSYLLAIKDAYNKPSIPGLGEILGVTFDTGSGYAWAAIFVQAIMDNYPGDERMLIKTAIHEMGHMRAYLSHLCYSPDTLHWYMSSDHDDVSCVMGTGKIAMCTGQDLTVNPHFCPKCCDRLGQVGW